MVYRSAILLFSSCVGSPSFSKLQTHKKSSLVWCSVESYGVPDGFSTHKSKPKHFSVISCSKNLSIGVMLQNKERKKQRKEEKKKAEKGVCVCARSLRPRHSLLLTSVSLWTPECRAVSSKSLSPFPHFPSLSQSLCSPGPKESFGALATGLPSPAASPRPVNTLSAHCDLLDSDSTACAHNVFIGHGCMWPFILQSPGPLSSVCAVPSAGGGPAGGVICTGTIKRPNSGTGGGCRP